MQFLTVGQIAPFRCALGIEMVIWRLVWTDPNFLFPGRIYLFSRKKIPGALFQELYCEMLNLLTRRSD